MAKARAKDGNVVAFRRRTKPLERPRVLALLQANGTTEVPSRAIFAQMVGWKRSRMEKALKAWEAEGLLTIEDRADGIAIIAKPADAVSLRPFGPGDNRERAKRKRKTGDGRPKAQQRQRARKTAEISADEERKNAAENGTEIKSNSESAPKAYRDKPATLSPRRKRQNAVMAAASESLRRNAPATRSAHANQAPRTRKNLLMEAASSAIGKLHSSTASGISRSGPVAIETAADIPWIAPPAARESVALPAPESATESPAPPVPEITRITPALLTGWWRPERTPDALLVDRRQPWRLPALDPVPVLLPSPRAPSFTAPRQLPPSASVLDVAPIAEPAPAVTESAPPPARESPAPSLRQRLADVPSPDVAGGAFAPTETPPLVTEPAPHSPAAPGVDQEKSTMGFFTRARALEAPNVERLEFRPKEAEHHSLFTDPIAALRRMSAFDRIMVAAAAALSAASGYLCITGALTFWPGDPTTFVVIAAIVEISKFVGVGWIAARARTVSFTSRWLVVALLINAELLHSGLVYNRLVNDHVGVAAERSAAYTTADAGRGADVEVDQGRLDATDRRIQTLDRVRRLTTSQRRERDALVADREKTRRELADARAGRTTLGAEHQRAEASSMPLRYTTELLKDVGLWREGTSPEKVARWLNFMFLMSLDPLALLMMSAVGSHLRRRKTS